MKIEKFPELKELHSKISYIRETIDEIERMKQKDCIEISTMTSSIKVPVSLAAILLLDKIKSDYQKELDKLIVEFESM